jgi:hypothetical protein
VSITICASFSAQKISSFRHSSHNFPLKLLHQPFSHGLPGSFVRVTYDFFSSAATNFCHSRSSPEGDSSKEAPNLYQPGVLLDSARTMYPVLDTLILLPRGPAPRKVTSTSIDWPGSIRCGEGKHNPVLLRFCVTKGAGFGFTMPPTTFTRRGNNAVNRGWRLRSGVDVICPHPLANSGV